MKRFGIYNDETHKLLTFIYSYDEADALTMAQRIYPNYKVSVIES